MPPLARWFIRTALVYLVAALLAGVALVLGSLLRLPPAIGALQPVYFHLLTVGWITQLIFGVVFWMFPKQSAARPRGSEGLGWATYWLLNNGLLLRAVGAPLVALLPASGAGWAFVANTRGRVKER